MNKIWEWKANTIPEWRTDGGETRRLREIWEVRHHTKEEREGAGGERGKKEEEKLSEGRWKAEAGDKGKVKPWWGDKGRRRENGGRKLSKGGEREEECYPENWKPNDSEMKKKEDKKGKRGKNVVWWNNTQKRKYETWKWK